MILKNDDQWYFKAMSIGLDIESSVDIGDISMYVNQGLIKLSIKLSIDCSVSGFTLIV